MQLVKPWVSQYQYQGLSSIKDVGHSMATDITLKPTGKYIIHSSYSFFIEKEFYCDVVLFFRNPELFWSDPAIYTLDYHVMLQRRPFN